jgi:hypothetical protein
MSRLNMAFFITEKKTEEWMERETRSITMPDGSTRPITDFKLMWHGFDFVLEHSSTIDEARLVELSLMSAQETGRSFEQQFPNVVAFAHRALRKHLGVD